MESTEIFDKNQIGLRLRKIRKQLKLTQEDISNELNIPQSNVSLYEQGKNAPSLNYLVAFAKRCNVSIDYLLGVSDNERVYDIRDLIKSDKALVTIEENTLSIRITDDEIKGLIEEKKK